MESSSHQSGIQQFNKPPVDVSPKQWWYNLSANTRGKVIAISAILIAWFFFSTIRGCVHRTQPSYVLEIMEQVNTPADVERYEWYFTPQGKSIVLWMMSSMQDRPASGDKATFSDPVIRDTICDVGGQVPGMTFTVRLIRSGHWQLHDIYLNRAGEQEIGIWVSYLKDHPYRSWWSANWKGFVTGFLIGLGGGG